MATKIAVINAEFIVRSWNVEGYPNYFFGQDKKLYRFDSRGRVKQNKRVVIGTTQGYTLTSRFYSLAQQIKVRKHAELQNTDYQLLIVP